MENRTCFKSILWKQNLFWEYIIKVINTTKYWLHEVAILGTYFLYFVKLKIFLNVLSRDKFIENIKVNEIKKSVYKGKQKLRRGNERGGGTW